MYILKLFISTTILIMAKNRLNIYSMVKLSMYWIIFDFELPLLCDVQTHCHCQKYKLPVLCAVQTFEMHVPLKRASNNFPFDYISKMTTELPTHNIFVFKCISKHGWHWASSCQCRAASALSFVLCNPFTGHVSPKRASRNISISE